MNSGIIKPENIDPTMISSTFNEIAGHQTLGSEFGVQLAGPETLDGLPIGTKIFVKSTEPELEGLAEHDSVGLVLAYDESGKMRVITLAPKDGKGWGRHNAYGEMTTEVPDAFAALDRLFDPFTEFGSIAVLSEVTGGLMGKSAAGTIGQAGCNSHEAPNLKGTLSSSQLLDTYDWKAINLLPDSTRLRRDGDGYIVHALPGQVIPGQPTRELRDQRSMFDRIQLVTQEDGSAVSALTEVDVLRGLETVIGQGKFADRELPPLEITEGIIKEAERIISYGS